MACNSKKRHILIVIMCLCLMPCISTPSMYAEEGIKSSPEKSEAEVLRIVYPGGTAYLNKHFMELHPNVSIEYLDWDPTDTSEYISNSDPMDEFRIDDPASPIVDIYVLSAVEGLPRLKREGHLLDLSTSQSISAAHETYFPLARELLSEDGKPVAVPIALRMCTWDYNKQEWDALGLPDVPRTAEEFVRLIGRWGQDIELPPETALYGRGGWYDLRIELLSDVLRMYVIENGTSSEALNFDTPEFRDVVSRIANLPELLPYDNGMREPLLLCCTMMYPYTYSLLDIDSSDWYKYNRMIGHDSELELILPMGFSEGGTAKIGVEMDVVCIARNTQNRELAIEYAEFILAHQADRQEDLSAMLTLDAQEMDALGIQKKTQELYRSLVPSFSFDIGALGKFRSTNHDGDYYYYLFASAYDLDLYGGISAGQFIGRLREDIEPLITVLNQQAQSSFESTY